jgi:hypothetical protein
VHSSIWSTLRRTEDLSAKSPFILDFLEADFWPARQQDRIAFASSLINTRRLSGIYLRSAMLPSMVRCFSVRGLHNDAFSATLSVYF